MELTMIISTLNQIVNRVLATALIIFMGAMILTVVWQVFTRFIINDPSVFTDELSRYLLIWIGILGGAYTYSVKRHLALELVMPKLNFRNRNLLSIFINLLVITFSSIALIYGGSMVVATTLQHHQISPGLAIGGNHLLIGYVYVVLPLSGVLINYYGLLDIFASIANIASGKKGDK
ncbi:TRAP transporter small permease [Agarivorans sp. QJM3NY_25]|uniref:TRAP transporter small permease n=1 Tax=Agarivorans sp. QJM3NY_25 TaxID=3421430 RepID=UPI003D7D2624